MSVLRDASPERLRPREPGRKPIHRVAYPCDLGDDYSVGTGKGKGVLQALIVLIVSRLICIVMATGRHALPTTGIWQTRSPASVT